MQYKLLVMRKEILFTPIKTFPYISSTVPYCNLGLPLLSNLDNQYTFWCQYKFLMGRNLIEPSEVTVKLQSNTLTQTLLIEPPLYNK